MSNVDFVQKVIEVMPVHRTIDVASSPNTILTAPSSGVTIVGGTGDPSIGSILEYPPSTGLALVDGNVVTLANGELILASVDDPRSAFGTIGVYESSSDSVIASGKITNAAWNWTSDAPLFLGRNGQLIEVPYNDGLFYLQIATVLTPTQIQVSIQSPVYL